MNSSQMSPSQNPNGLVPSRRPLPLLDAATILGGSVLSAAGLVRGGLRGWISTSLGTLLIYRGVLALQEHAAANADQCRGEPPAFNERWPGLASTARDESIADPSAPPARSTCVSPGIIGPM